MLNSLSQFWGRIQQNLFSHLNEQLGPLSEKQQRLVVTLEMARVEELVGYQKGMGRPVEDRAAIARAFLAKAVYNFPTTRVLLDRLNIDIVLRRICGWERKMDIPHEATFSRAFAEFAESALASHAHEVVIEQFQGERLVGHILRDATAIEAREKAVKKTKISKESSVPKPKRRGRPKKGEEHPKVPSRLKQQQNMTLPQMLADLPKHCDVGCKKNSDGFSEFWKGYKLHIDAADGQIPISCVLTSASVHDSQVALPLMAMTERRVDYLYDVMDAAYDADVIRFQSLSQGRRPLIDPNPAHGKAPFAPHEAQRYKERTAVERVNARLKDEFGGRYVRVRGHAKVMAHLMFGILALTTDQLMRFVV